MKIYVSFKKMANCQGKLVDLLLLAPKVVESEIKTNFGGGCGVGDGEG
jgi:hypothetical protein